MNHIEQAIRTHQSSSRTRLKTSCLPGWTATSHPDAFQLLLSALGRAAGRARGDPGCRGQRQELATGDAAGRDGDAKGLGGLDAR